MRTGETDRKRVVEEFERLFYDSLRETWAAATWLGVRAFKLPLDLWVLQEIVTETRPDLIIESGVAEGGSALFLANVLDLIGGEGRVIGVDVDLSKVAPETRNHPRVSLVEGSSTEPKVLARLAAAAEGRRVMVDLDSDHSALHVTSELRALSPLVSPGCYLVVEDGVVNGNPVEPNFGPGPTEALEEWLSTKPPFEVDTSREKFLATFNPGGYLRRVEIEGAPAPAPPPPAARPETAPAQPFAAETPPAGLEVSEVHQPLADLVPEGSRVLELGCGAGELSAVLRERRCTVVGVEEQPELAAQAEEVCDRVHRRALGDPALEGDLGEERFDAIVGVHAVEQGGAALLEIAHKHLEPEGRLVLAVANAAHASVRLALLAGELPRGEGDSPNLAGARAYTLETLERELADAGFGLGRIVRQKALVPETGAEDPLQRSVAARLADDPEASTLRFIAVAYPMARADLELQQAKISDLARRADALETELERTREAVTGEQEAREELAEAKQELAEQRPELEALRESLRRSSARVRELRDALIAATEKADTAGAESQRLTLMARQLEHDLHITREQLERRDAEATAAEVRIKRIHSTPPFRFYLALRRVPPLSWIASRRAAGYQRELERARDAG